MNPYPLYALNLRKLLKKLRKSSSAIEIKSIICCILRDDDQLPYALVRETTCLLDQLLHWNRLMRSPYERNRTV